MEMGLHKYELSLEEWGQLASVLKILKDATLFFSGFGLPDPTKDHTAPNLATVILAMDHLEQVLKSFLSDSDYDITIGC
ncbi:hypothetical protein F5148DRAFT_1288773 [Russula earlei]|uniref:Uncharacterized protein n=1 Tax=Russula earlei TaxID=71964 RepID=A0ACC0U0M8_9AGAM|nr:hypothetical protein F5148DRAFT_1288773 [Russula earlei]